MPSFISTKPRVSVIRTSNGIAVGQIRFHSVSSNKIDLTVNGHETSISHTGFMHNRWGFQSTTCPNTSETWYWKKDRETGGAMLEDAKRNGSVLARMKGDLLSFEKASLSQEQYEEVVMSAVAMAEAARRQKRKSDVVDIAAAVGDFASSDGKHVIEGGVGGSWG